ncbi:MAG: hypothetical protein AB8H80_17125 [Planctomycetota bacterium]
MEADADTDLSRQYFVHGYSVGDCVWRVGPGLPPASLPNGFLLVSGNLAATIRDLDVHCVRASYLVKSLPKLAWAQWSDSEWFDQVDRLKRATFVDSVEELVVPFLDVGGEYLRSGDLSRLRASVQAGREMVLSPDLWWVRPRDAIESLDGREMRGSGSGFAPIMQIG